MADYYLVRRARGAAWDLSRPRREQPGWDEHAAFMDALVREGLVVLGGPVGEGDGDDALLVVDVEDEQEIVARLADDPWGCDMLTTTSVEPWSVWLRAVAPVAAQDTSDGWEARADRLAGESLALGDPTGWFERLYSTARDGEVSMPWSRTTPHPMLVDWAQTRGLAGSGQRALVIGCGLGADAEYVAEFGYATVAFDISDTAIELVRDRFPASTVEYVTANLLDPPGDWVHGFDLVVEVHTVQALPASVRSKATANVARLVGPGGTLIVIAAAGKDAARLADGPPWPLTRSEIDGFETGGVHAVRVEELHDDDERARARWRAEFRRTA